MVEHWAGSPLTAPPNEMFQRRTDQFVHQTLGKRPLDVGADRIARTAHAALRLLQQVRIELGRPLPLAWDATTEGAIEVYPAATLISRGWSTKDYKKTGELGLSARTSIVEKLQTELLIELPQPCRESDDELDAVICTLAGRDFLRGRCHEPHDLPLAQKEGWIWVRKAEQP